MSGSADEMSEFDPRSASWSVTQEVAEDIRNAKEKLEADYVPEIQRLFRTSPTTDHREFTYQLNAELNRMFVDTTWYLDHVAEQSGVPKKARAPDLERLLRDFRSLEAYVTHCYYQIPNGDGYTLKDKYKKCWAVTAEARLQAEMRWGYLKLVPENYYTTPPTTDQ